MSEPAVRDVETTGRPTLVVGGVVLGVVAVVLQLVRTLGVETPAIASSGAVSLVLAGLAWVAIVRGLHMNPSDGEPRRLWAVAGIVAQLLALVAIARVFTLESRAFHQVFVPLVLLGFVLHELTPRRFRPAFFLALSLTTICVMMGLVDGLWLVALGLFLVGVCHLPVRFSLRVVLLLGIGLGLAFMRNGMGELPWSQAVWPILGSIFMFRLIIYLYDLKHGKVSPGLAHRLGYFFLLPNIAFPLFPVVDYGAYRRGYYDKDRIEIYQRGIDWMLRGVIQLVLYRLVYQEFTIAAEAVETWDQLARHFLSTFLLYVRVSGQFHVAIGILHLFGYALPETHDAYALSSSFTDLWRRINIYWKDFMMKIVYYPVFFRLRRHGMRVGTTIAVMAVFVTTWALHSYQWFWLLGDFPLNTTDLIFWGILGLILVFGALRELRPGGAARAGRESAPTATSRFRSAIRVTGTVGALIILWSLWMSPSVTDWWALWADVEGFSDDVAERAVPVILVSGMLLYGFGGAVLDRLRDRLPSGGMVTAAVASLVLFAGWIPQGALPGFTREYALAMRTAGLNDVDMSTLTRGYYEDLMDVSRFNSQLWEVYMGGAPREGTPDIWETPAARMTDDLLVYELLPSVETSFLGHRFTTNTWGFRDREYEQTPGPETVRMALLGASIEMGQGVADGETFESVLEERLNKEAGRDRAVEILNFARANYSLMQQLVFLDRALEFDPGVLILAVHEVDVLDVAERVIEWRELGLEIPFEPLRKIIEEEGLATASSALIDRRLEGRKAEIESRIYEAIVEASLERDVVPVWLFVPTVERPPGRELVAEMEERAKSAGFTVISLVDAFDGFAFQNLAIDQLDPHPNVAGHVLLAEEFYERLREHPELLETRGEREGGR